VAEPSRIPRPAPTGPPPSPSLEALARQIARREVSAVDTVQAALARIDAADGTLHAFCTRVDEQALADAEAVDGRLASGDPVGPLAGVPVAIKDLLSTRNIRTTYGSPLYADHVPDEDDVVVERLKAAGAIVIGKTNTSEFGYGPVGHNPCFPASRNPWDPALTPGGSSAGSAAAVAAGMVPLALGSDGGGSIRIPAALCGLFGMKASWGRVPLHPGCRDDRFPGASGWESLEHVGPLTRSVADAALAFAVLAGPTPRDRHSLPSDTSAWTIAPPETLRNVRLAFSPDLGFATVDSEVRDIAAKAAQRFAEVFGCAIEIAAPDIENPQSSFEALVALDTDRAGLRRLASEQGYRFDGALGRLLERDWSADEFTAAIMARKRIANSLWRFMQCADFLVTPTTSVAAFAVGLEGPAEIAGTATAPSDWVPFSSLANLTGQPAASIPAGFTSDGRPVGIQVMGRHLDDAGVLTVAAGFETVAPWAGHWPGVLEPGRPPPP